MSDCQKYKQRRRKGSWQKALWQPQLYGKIYHQQARAPIGARASRVGCRFIRNIHDKVVAEMLEKVNNKPDLAFRYVEDERFHVKGIKPDFKSLSLPTLDLP